MEYLRNRYEIDAFGSKGYKMAYGESNGHVTDDVT